VLVVQSGQKKISQKGLLGVLPLPAAAVSDAFFISLLPLLGEVQTLDHLSQEVPAGEHPMSILKILRL